MTAINWKYTTPMESAIKALGERWCGLHTLGLTHDEFLSLFVSSEDADLLKRAGEIAANRGGTHGTMFRHEALRVIGGKVANVHFNVVDTNGRAPVLPRNGTMLGDAPAEITAKIAAWVAERAEIMFNTNRTLALLSWLNENCASPSQIRFLWPTILALCSLDETTVELGDKLRELKAPRSLPALPPEVKAACRSTAGFVTSAMLLGKEEAKLVAHSPVTCSLAGLDAAKHEGALGLIQGF